MSKKEETSARELYEVAKTGNPDLVRKLISSGAPVNGAGEGRYGPLHVASAQGHELVVKTLLELGASPFAIGKLDRTALHCASRGGHVSIAKLLVRAGANVNAQDRWLDTPLHDAARVGNDELVNFLLQAGADATLRNGYSTGMTPADLTNNRALKDVILEAKGTGGGGRDGGSKSANKSYSSSEPPRCPRCAASEAKAAELQRQLDRALNEIATLRGGGSFGRSSMNLTGGANGTGNGTAAAAPAGARGTRFSDGAGNVLSSGPRGLGALDASRDAALDAKRRMDGGSPTGTMNPLVERKKLATITDTEPELAVVQRRASSKNLLDRSSPLSSPPNGAVPAPTGAGAAGGLSRNGSSSALAQGPLGNAARTYGAVSRPEAAGALAGARPSTPTETAGARPSTAGGPQVSIGVGARSSPLSGASVAPGRPGTAAPPPGAVGGPSAGLGATAPMRSNSRGGGLGPLIEAAGGTGGAGGGGGGKPGDAPPGGAPINMAKRLAMMDKRQSSFS